MKTLTLSIVCTLDLVILFFATYESGNYLFYQNGIANAIIGAAALISLNGFLLYLAKSNETKPSSDNEKAA